MEATDDVDTDGADTARAVRVDRKVRRTFVYVPAASLRVSSASRVTLALRPSRCDGTCRVLAALNPSTRIFASVAFQDVWREALALSLDTLFVGRTVWIVSAANADGRAALAWISCVPRCTEALVGSQCIPALGILTARRPLADFFTLVNVSTESGGFQCESLGADTEAIARPSEDALLVFRTRVCGRAVSTNQDAVLSLPHEGVLAAAGSFLVSVLDAQGVPRTLVVLVALNFIRVAGGVSVTHVTTRALAEVAALQVRAERAQATGGAGLELCALVDVPAPCNRRIVSEASPTDALAPSIN